MTVSTGIPPHIRQAVLIKSTLDVCKETLQKAVEKDFIDGVKDSVKQGFEEKAEECGQMTGERMKIMINKYHDKVEILINTKLTDLTNSFPLNPNQNDKARNDNDVDGGIVFAEGKEELVVINNNQTIRHQLYAYDSYFWHLPKDFEFPMGVHLDIGWKLLDLWKPSNETIDANHIRVQAPVCPFRIPKPAMLPPGACSKKFQLNWRPIFSLMEGVPDMEILPAMGTDSILFSFSIGKEYLTARVSHAFESERATPDQDGKY